MLGWVETHFFSKLPSLINLLNLIFDSLSKLSYI
jgi:hypothetical protein